MSDLLNHRPLEKLFSVNGVIAAFYYDPMPTPVPPYEESFSFWQLFYVVRGSLEIENAQGRRRVRAGEVLFRKPDAVSKMIYPPDGSLELAIVDFTCDSEKMSFFGDKILSLYGEEGTALLELTRTGAKLFDVIDRKESRVDWFLSGEQAAAALQYVAVSIERLLLMLYCRLQKIPLLLSEQTKVNQFNHESRLVKQINRFLYENRFRSLSIDGVAAHFGINAVTMMKLYKRETGTSILDHFLDLKIWEAEQLIVRTDCNFTQISENLGFSSINYFSKTFKKRTGLTPTEFSQQKTKRR